MGSSVAEFGASRTRPNEPPGKPDQARYGGSRPHAGALLLGFWLLVLAASIVWWLFDPNAVFLAMGSAACCVATLPVLRRQSSLLSPWTVVVAGTYVACGLRGGFIAFGVDDGKRSLQDLFLLGEPPASFIWPSVVYLLGISLLTSSFLVVSANVQTKRNADKTTTYHFRRSAIWIALVLAGVGFGAFILFVQRTGGVTGLAHVSEKRTTIPGLTLGDDYQSFGTLRFVSGLSAAAWWALLAYYAKTGRKLRLLSMWGILLTVLGINAIALPVYASSRTDAAFALIVGWVVWRMLRPGRIPWRAVVVVGVVLLFLLGSLTFFRHSAAAGSTSGFSSSLPGSVAEALVYNRNFGDMETAAHIMQNVPYVIPYQDGGTIIRWAAAPIPRSLWPTKPIVNIGPLIGTVIYGTAIGGVPPGFVGDWFLNFGVLGVLVGSIILGALLGVLEVTRLRIVGSPSPAVAILFASVAFEFAVGAMGKGVGAAFYGAMSAAAPALFVLALVGVWRRSSPDRAVARVGPAGRA